MPSLKDLKNRIASVKATQKITKAMKMVAAAKLRRAQEAAEAARPYSQRMAAVLANIAQAVGADDSAPRLMTGTGRDDTHLVIVCTAERGLCGGFNSQIARFARDHVRKLLAQGKTVKIICVGKKGFDMLRRDFASLIIDRVDLREVKKIGLRTRTGSATRSSSSSTRASSTSAPCSIPSSSPSFRRSRPPSSSSRHRPAKWPLPKARAHRRSTNTSRKPERS